MKCLTAQTLPSARAGFPFRVPRADRCLSFVTVSYRLTGGFWHVRAKLLRIRTFLTFKRYLSPSEESCVSV